MVSIGITPEVKKILNNMKSKGESYNDLIEKMIEDELEINNATLKELEKSKKEQELFSFGNKKEIWLMTYNLIWKDHAVKELGNLDKLAIKRIVEKIEELLINPSSCDFKSLKGHHGLFRLRVGHYRAIFEHDESNLTILKVGSRQNIYEGF